MPIFSRLTWTFCLAAGLALGCRQSDDGRKPDSPTKSEKLSAQKAKPRDQGVFIDATARLKVDFRHSLGEPGSFFFPEVFSGGCAMFDFDRDGDLDIYWINGGSPTDTAFATNDGAEDPPQVATNHLFRQETDGTFTDITGESGLGDPGYGMGVAIGDINNDGLPDVYVTNFGADSLYVNLGGGAFEDITKNAGIDNRRWGVSACFLDYDNDGWLDLYVSNYVNYDPSKQCINSRGERGYCSPEDFRPAADVLFRNRTGDNARDEHAGDAKGRIVFEDVSLKSGIALKAAAGLGVASADFSGDGFQDIYVANDEWPNFLWINQRDGTFAEEAVLQGCAFDTLGREQGGMGIAIGDVNEDLQLDLFVTNFRDEPNVLYFRDAEGYTVGTRTAGLFAPSFAQTGFGTSLLDFDHDTDLDLVILNGRVKHPRSSDDVGLNASSNRTSIGEIDPFWQPLAEQNQLLINEGGRFRMLDAAQDAFLSNLGISRGLATGDLDNDGDLDLLVSNAASQCRVYLNELPQKGNWLTVRAIDENLGGRDVYGAEVTVSADGNRWRQLISTKFSYASAGDPRAHFGLGTHSEIEEIAVRWPDGEVETFSGGALNIHRTVVRGMSADR